MNRDSSPEIEIVSEFIQNRPSVEVVLPQLHGCQPSHINGSLKNNNLSSLPTVRQAGSQQVRQLLQNIPPRTTGMLERAAVNHHQIPSKVNGNFSPSNGLVSLRPWRSLQKPEFSHMPQISQVCSLKPLTERRLISKNGNNMALSKSNGTIIPGVKIRPAPIKQIMPHNIQNGGATATAVIQDTLRLPRFSEFQPQDVTAHNVIASFSQQINHLHNQPKSLQNPQQKRLHKPARKRKRSCSSSSSSSSNSIICNDIHSVTTKAPLPKSIRTTNVSPVNIPTTAVLKPGRSNVIINGNISNSFPYYLYGRVKPAGWVAKEFDEDATDIPFFCGICEKVVCNNVSLMWHAFAHYLHKNEGPEEDLVDLSICWKCLRNLGNPFNLMEHINKVHGVNTGSTCICHICEIELPNSIAFNAHVKNNHNSKQDMPYVCPVCKFQSSLYTDITNHFAQDHANTNLLMCPFCLTLINESKERGYSSYRNVFNTNVFSQHISLHMEKMESFRCDRCILMFTTPLELSKHKAKFHCSVIANGIQLPVIFDECRPLTTYGEQKIKMQPSRSFLRPLNLHFDETHARCIECRRWMIDDEHFLLNECKGCSICNFVTSCALTHKMHMTGHAKSGSKFVNNDLFQRIEPILDVMAKCNCGFQTILGNKIAEHVQLCSESFGTATLLPNNGSNCSNSESLDLMPKKMLLALGLRHSIVTNGAEKPPSPVEIASEDSRDVCNSNSLCTTPSTSITNEDAAVLSPRRLSLLPQSGRKKLDHIFSALAVSATNEKVEMISKDGANSSNKKSQSFVGKCRRRMNKVDHLKSNVEVIWDQYKKSNRLSKVEKYEKTTNVAVAEETSDSFDYG